MTSSRQMVYRHTGAVPDINNSCRASLALWTANGIVSALQTPSNGHYMKVFLRYFVGIVYFMYPFIKKPSEALPSWVLL